MYGYTVVAFGKFVHNVGSRRQFGNNRKTHRRSIIMEVQRTVICGC